MTGTCSIHGCEKPVFGRGWCHMHWNRWRRNGDAEALVFDGHSRTHEREYRIWLGLRYRCNSGDPNYGGRGIKVCARWDESFAAFMEDMGPRPSPRHSIDRIDNDGDYEPGNCRWATIWEQAVNKRNSAPRLTVDGRTQTVAEWADELSLNRYTVWWRVRHGWSDEDALRAPRRKAA